jgi:hypothetical protein
MLPLKDEQLRAMGRVSVRFNDLEFLTNALAWHLINPNLNIGRLVLEGENFDRVLTRIKRLSEEVSRKNPGLGSRIQLWASTADDLKRRRNEVIHSQIVLDAESLDMIGWKRQRRGHYEVDLSVGELDRLADKMESAIEELEQIIELIA